MKFIFVWIQEWLLERALFRIAKYILRNHGPDTLMAYAMELEDVTYNVSVAITNVGFDEMMTNTIDQGDTEDA